MFTYKTFCDPELETLQKSDTVPAALGICEIPIQTNYTDKKDQRFMEVINV